jgi:large subunit ribosomal protein L35
MPKQKTNKSAAKRFRVTRRGKVMRHMAGSGHLLAKKSRKRKRNLRRVKSCQPMDAKRMKRLLGYMG